MEDISIIRRWWLGFEISLGVLIFQSVMITPLISQADEREADTRLPSR
jgi:hypothetical protein